MFTLQLLIAAALLLSQVADLVSTDYAIRHGYVEANPLMRKRSVRYGVKLLVGVLFAIGVLTVPATWESLTIFGVVSLAVFAIALRNFVLAWEHRQVLVRRLQAIARLRL